MTFGNYKENAEILSIDGDALEIVSENKLLGITIDCKLTTHQIHGLWWLCATGFFLFMESYLILCSLLC